MSTTTNLKLPYLIAAQAQKHVTHNEALRALDAIVHLSVLDRDLAAPPASPADADRYLVAPGATGAWSGMSGSIAAFQDGAWTFHTPRVGWICFISDETIALVWNGSAWISAFGSGAPSGTLAASPHGATIRAAILEEEVTLAGASTDTTIAIPDRAIVLAVSTRTTVAVTGATSYGCGIAGDITKYGNLLGIAAGSTNSGVTGPTAFYAATPIRITANGSTFTGGKVRIAIQYLTCGASAN